MANLLSNELLESISDLQRSNGTFAVTTVLTADASPRKLIIGEDGSLRDVLNGDLPDELLQRVGELARGAISSGSQTMLQSVTAGSNDYTVAIEVIRPKPSVVVFGAGHVGQAVALMASMIGYAVTAVDDREAFANRKRLPGPNITLVAEPYDTAAAAVQITSNTAVVIVTRGHQYDELCLRAVVESRARYIGMIGSRRRVISVFKQLTESGIDGKLLDRVHAPIGLPISARSPQEIAVAILAEIIQTFNSQVADSTSS
jgi:xanthine dehydrogenase accessory factor